MGVLKPLIPWDTLMIHAHKSWHSTVLGVYLELEGNTSDSDPNSNPNPNFRVDEYEGGLRT